MCVDTQPTNVHWITACRKTQTEHINNIQQETLNGQTEYEYTTKTHILYSASSCYVVALCKNDQLTTINTLPPMKTHTHHPQFQTNMSSNSRITCFCLRIFSFVKNKYTNTIAHQMRVIDALEQYHVANMWYQSATEISRRGLLELMKMHVKRR